ncbi:ATP-dependent DNA helicase Q1 [Strongyloides ratti]|uniref:ATP-dependent DNA helicase n=1 Tax=Strongyloides ratti TaxID=34506 RepID=A0A090L1C6_STRRB|nr:ATP-dependent DNA helicase Q1 [Strongyloides ratti]CEF63506.1 ATP-dependent DNA helicase Q1 [Strongyloides ratti]
MERDNLLEQLDKVNSKIDRIRSEINQLRREEKNFLKIKEKLENELKVKDNDVDDDLSFWETPDKPWLIEGRKLLNEVFQLSDFRPLQISAISAILSKKDCLLIMATGGGKSLCYQLPSLLCDGVTLVISPLISLIEDQIRQLKKLSINACSFNQSTDKAEVKQIMDDLSSSKPIIKLLYVTPERLAKSKKLMNKLDICSKNGNLNFIAVDEVHCCSTWGHDFRPDYKFLNILKRQFGVPIIGLTATATSKVVDDIKDMLEIPRAIVFKAGFNRENLVYEVRDKPNSLDEFVMEVVNEIKENFKGQSGIIYCYSRKDCEDLNKKLKLNGIKSAFYHAYMEDNYRTKVHDDWSSGKIDIIVATIAFGMGIDKPDVRFVIHHSISKSMENYYQESGRAGRDGKKSKCILYYCISDVFRLSSMANEEKCGLDNLNEIVKYSIEIDSCRRILIASHFNEVWEPSWCNNHCDNCSNSKRYDVSSINIYEYFEKCIEIIGDYMKKKEERITGNKLVEVVAKYFKEQTKSFIKKVISKLILDGFLNFDFKYTPYSIITYIQPGMALEYKSKEMCTMKILDTEITLSHSKKKRKIE